MLSRIKNSVMNWEPTETLLYTIKSTLKSIYNGAIAGVFVGTIIDVGAYVVGLASENASAFLTTASKSIVAGDSAIAGGLGLSLIVVGGCCVLGSAAGIIRSLQEKPEDIKFPVLPDNDESFRSTGSTHSDNFKPFLTATKKYMEKANAATSATSSTDEPARAEYSVQPETTITVYTPDPEPVLTTPLLLGQKKY